MDITSLTVRVDADEFLAALDVLNNHVLKSDEFVECLEARFPDIADMMDFTPDGKSVDAGFIVHPSAALKSFMQDLI